MKTFSKQTARPAKRLLATLVASVLVGVGGQAQASFLTDTFTSGVENTYEDNSREAYVDVNSDGIFSAGDVILGFAKIEAKTSQSGADTNLKVWAIFSQEVEAVGQGTSGLEVFFKPTTVDGLKLSDIVGAADANDMVAMFSSYTALTNLTIFSPGDLTANGTITLADYFKYIQDNTTLDFIAGRVDSTSGGFCGTTNPGADGDDCFSALAQSNPLSTFQIGAIGGTLNGASFSAGLEVTKDPAGWTLLDLVASNNTSGADSWGTLAEFAISGGDATGGAGAVNVAQWGSVAEFGNFTQCRPSATANEGSIACGFINNLDFGIHPLAVPEPGALALLGIGLMGLGVMRRPRRKA